MVKLGVTVNLGSGFHPQANGQVEPTRRLSSSCIILLFSSRGLDSVPALGWVCPKLPMPLNHPTYHFPMYDRIPATPVPMECQPLGFTNLFSDFLPPVVYEVNTQFLRVFEFTNPLYSLPDLYWFLPWLCLLFSCFCLSDILFVDLMTCVCFKFLPLACILNLLHEFLLKLP